MICRRWVEEIVVHRTFLKYLATYYGLVPWVRLTDEPVYVLGLVF
jgi:hypothetical protein